MNNSMMLIEEEAVDSQIELDEFYELSTLKRPNLTLHVKNKRIMDTTTPAFKSLFYRKPLTEEEETIV